MVQGVRNKVFGLASGSSWEAEDAVLRFGTLVDPSEVQFQPGLYLVRAAAIASRVSEVEDKETGSQVADKAGVSERDVGPAETGDTQPTAGSDVQSAARRITVRLVGVPADKARDVIKTAVFPLAAESTEVRLDLVIRAEGGAKGFSRNTVDLVVKEGLRQLGLEDVEIVEE